MAELAAAGQSASAGAPCPRAIHRCGLSPRIVSAYLRLGIIELFDWQSAAMTQPVLDGACNLVYTATTSAGKTLVAELLMLRRLEDSGSNAKALFVLPLNAIAMEKTQYFESLLRGTGLTAAAYFDGHGELPMPPTINVAVCSIEKAGMLVQSMAEAGRLGEIVCVVVDEFHMLGDETRGLGVERTLAKLLLHSRRLRAAAARPAAPPDPPQTPCASVLSSRSSGSGGSGIVVSCAAPLGVQLIGMSATLANIGQLAEWMEPCQVYEGEAAHRPVPLMERIVTPGPHGAGRPALRDRRGNPVAQSEAAAFAHEIAYTATKTAAVAATALDDLAVALCRPVHAAGKSSLVFCASKAQCAKLAHKLGSALCSAASAKEAAADAVRRVSEELEHACPDGAFEGLAACVEMGAAFYHAGLGVAEKTVLQAAAASGAIKLWVSTTALGEGVNLPVRRVVIRELKTGISPLTTSRYRQMAGRAGRKGLETLGEVCACSSALSALPLRSQHLAPRRPFLRGRSSCSCPSVGWRRR